MNIKKDFSEEFDKYNNIFNSIIDMAKKYQSAVDNIKLSNQPNKLYYYYNEDTKFIELLANETLQNKSIKNKVSIYFANNKTNNFIEYLTNNEIIKNNKFFENYMNNYNALTEKIKNLLDKINNGELKKIESSPKINDELKNKKEKIIKSCTNRNINLTKKGKYTVILPYTDVLFLYFIDLLIIIDYITTMYE